MKNPANGAANGAFGGQVAPFAPCLPGETGGHGANGATPRAPGPRNGAGMAQPAAHLGAARSAAEIVAQLEEAGGTLLALPPTGYSTRLRTSKLDIVRSVLDGTDTARSETARLRPPVPDNGRITRMDEAYGWLALLPQDRYVLRRIVGARSLVNPLTERHLYPWRRLAALLGADHKAVQRWHAQGIDLIVRALSGGVDARPEGSKKISPQRR